MKEIGLFGTFYMRLSKTSDMAMERPWPCCVLAPSSGLLHLENSPVFIGTKRRDQAITVALKIPSRIESN